MSLCYHIKKIKKENINFCISSDGLATGKSLDLLEQCAYYKSKNKNITNTELLKSITLNPMRFFNYPTNLLCNGSIANFCIFDYNNDVDLNEFLENLFSKKHPKILSICFNGIFKDL